MATLGQIAPDAKGARDLSIPKEQRRVLATAAAPEAPLTHSNRTIVIFDGECVLCNGWVRFILGNERDDMVHFAARDSAAGIRLAAQYGFTPADLDHSYVVIEGGKALVKSDAGLALLAHLNPPYRWLRLGRIIPKALRDAAYDSVARNRYRWFGKQDCLIPPPAQRHRFLED